VATLADARLLRRVVAIWTTKLAERRQIRWRSDMRTRMKAVRERREQGQLVTAWTKWKLAVRARVAERVHDVQVLELAVGRWKGKMRRIREMENVAEAHDERGDMRAALKAWGRWRWMSEVRHREVALAEAVNRRVVRDMWIAWKKRMSVDSRLLLASEPSNYLFQATVPTRKRLLRPCLSEARCTIVESRS
jgi:protein SFI1